MSIVGKDFDQKEVDRAASEWTWHYFNDPDPKDPRMADPENCELRVGDFVEYKTGFAAGVGRLERNYSDEFGEVWSTKVWDPDGSGELIDMWFSRRELSLWVPPERIIADRWWYLLPEENTMGKSDKTGSGQVVWPVTMAPRWPLVVLGTVGVAAITFLIWLTLVG